jgi:CRP-like cAMP-binding protein/Zn-dependent protease
MFSHAERFPGWWPAGEAPGQIMEGDTDLWGALKSDLDIQQYAAWQRAGIIVRELTDRNGRHYMLKNGLTHSYVRLSPEEFWVWEKLNGRTTIQQLVFAYFKEFKAFAFGAIVSLLDRLRDANMLSEPPRVLYRELSRAIEERKLSYKLSWLARTFFTREFAIKGLNGHLDRIYRKSGRYLFSVPVQVILLLIASIGTYFFIQLIRDPTYHLLQRDLIVQLGLLAYIPIVIHEFGHAITAKHVGCEVHKGGIMLYYGLPAAFVDTTDAWMFRKRDRLAITWAGPYTGFIIAGTCSLLVHFLPNLFSPAVTVQILQIALVAFTLSTINLLPVLKLDGYYLLADALEIPRLRERSMEFITHRLSMKVKERHQWTGEEKILFAYGIIGFLSTFYFTWIGLLFWDQQASRSILGLLKQQGDFLVNAGYVGVIILAISSVGYSLILLSNEVKKVLRWLEKKGFLSTRERAALVILLCIAVLVLLPWLALPTLKGWVLTASELGAFALAVWMVLGNFISMRGSIYRWIWLAALLGLIAGMGNLVLELNTSLAIWKTTLPGWIFNLLPARILYLSLFFILAGRLSRDLEGSWREFSLFLIALGMALHGSGFANIETRAVAACLVLGGLIHWHIRPRSQFEIQEPEQPTASTREKTTAVFNWIKKMLLSEVELDFGALTRSKVESGIYPTKKKGAGKTDFSFDLAGIITPGEIGRGMAVELEELLGNVERVAGSAYTRRVLAYGYDTLNWELQEIAEDYILKYVPHAQGLSNDLSTIRNDLEVLLRSVPLFMSLRHKVLNKVCKRFRSRHFARNTDIIRAGEPGTTFYIIRTGRVEVLSPDGKSLNQLGRGDYFGEMALLTNEKRNATIRALTSVEALELDKAHFDTFIRTDVHFDAKARSEFGRLALLREIPIFEQFNGNELMMISKRMERVEVARGAVIFTQGEIGDSLYIVDTGEISVEIDSTVRAKLEAGEYFGEMALIMDFPRTATVIALQPTVLLRLQSSDFRQLLQSSLPLRQGLERTSSRRMLLNERWSRHFIDPNSAGL